MGKYQMLFRTFFIFFCIWICSFKKINFIYLCDFLDVNRLFLADEFGLNSYISLYCDFFSKSFCCQRGTIICQFFLNVILITCFSFSFINWKIRGFTIQYITFIDKTLIYRYFYSLYSIKKFILLFILSRFNLDKVA